MSRCVVLAERQESEGEKGGHVSTNKVNVNDELKKVYCEAKCRIRRQVVLINYAPTQNVGTFQACVCQGFQVANSNHRHRCSAFDLTFRREELAWNRCQRQSSFFPQ